MDSPTHSDVLLKELKLTLGGKLYVVPVLRMRQAAKWREEYIRLTKEVSEHMEVETGDSADMQKQISNAVTGALLKFPEKIPELVFSYAPKTVDGIDLPREEIMESAYDQEFSIAFELIWKEAFRPFLTSLATGLWMQKASASHSASSESLN